MERRREKQKKKKAGFLKNCLLCIVKNDEDEHNNLWNRNNQPPKLMSAKHEMSLTYAASSYYLMNPELGAENISPNNALLSLAYSEKIENPSNETEPNPPPVVDSSKDAEKEKKDQMVRTILGKYLQMKREEMLNKKLEPHQENPKSFKSQKNENSDFLSVECCSSDNSDVLVLENVSSGDTTKPKGEFPTKSRSAPTNSTAHDSLADICFKMSRFKQQENKSDSYVTCCSEENSKETENTTKKLELIFNRSSEDNLCLEDNSSVSLRYQISCEKIPVATGILKTDSLLLRNSDEGCYDYVKKYPTKFPYPELYLNPTAKREVSSMNGSSASLKWKLIISHHGRGDFR